MRCEVTQSVIYASLRFASMCGMRRAACGVQLRTGFPCTANRKPQAACRNLKLNIRCLVDQEFSYFIIGNSGHGKFDWFSIVNVFMECQLLTK